jgi:hypothetical protein
MVVLLTGNGVTAVASLLDAKGARQGKVTEATTLSAGSGRGWVVP